MALPAAVMLLWTTQLCCFCALTALVPAAPTTFTLVPGGGRAGKPMTARLFGCNLPHYLIGVGTALTNYSDGGRGTASAAATALAGSTSAHNFDYLIFWWLSCVCTTYMSFDRA